MLNGEKTKLRKMPTTSASLIRKTRKLSSFFAGLAGGGGEASAGSGWGVAAAVIGGLELSDKCVTILIHAWTTWTSVQVKFFPRSLRALPPPCGTHGRVGPGGGAWHYHGRAA